MISEIESNIAVPKTWQDEMQLLMVKHGQGLTPKIVLNFARQTNTALHKQFEWSNDEAADKFRLIQARQLITRVKAVYLKDPNSGKITRIEAKRVDKLKGSVRLRRFVSMRIANSTNSYHDLEKVLDNKVTRKEMVLDRIDRIRVDAEWLERYGFAADVKPIFIVVAKIRKAIDELAIK